MSEFPTTCVSEPEFEKLIEEKAQANIRWLIENGHLKNEPEKIEGSLKYARAIARVNELNKQERNFTYGPPREDLPFVGCNQICDIKGVLGPNDHCIRIKHASGILYFCNSPKAQRLSDGTLPLCFDYHQTEWNKGGIKAVKKGRFRVQPR